MFRFESIFFTFVQILFLMLVTVQAYIPGPEITSTGACPPKPILSWNSLVPPKPNTTLIYNVFCCGIKDAQYCYKPQNNHQKLKDLLCCQRSSSQPGTRLSCDVTEDALKNIYKADEHQFFLYTAYVVTDGANYTQYSTMSRLNLLPRKITCTEPSNFSISVNIDNVTVYWGMPPRMACKTFRFRLTYSAVPDGCSDDEDENDSPNVYTKTYIQGSNITNFQTTITLKPRREYKFSLTCDVFEDKESSKVVARVRTLSQAPRDRPYDLQLRTIYFENKRNITLSWKISCPSRWSRRNDYIRLVYYPFNTTALNRTKSIQQSNRATLVDSTSIRVTPNLNSFVISNLDRYQEWRLALALCNEVGCGPETIQNIEAERKPNATIWMSKKEWSKEGGNVVGITVGSAVGGVALAFLVVVIFKFVKRTNNSSVDVEQPQKKLSDLMTDVAPEFTSQFTELKKSHSEINTEYSELTDYPSQNLEESANPSTPE